MTRQLRVLMTADTVGGVFTYACELIAALRGRGVNVALATMGEPLRSSQARTLAALDNVEVFESSFALEWMPSPWRDVDAAGNISSVFSFGALTIDATPPNAPAITGFSDDTGALGDHVTADTTLTLSGTAEANAKVSVFDGVNLLTATLTDPAVLAFYPGRPTDEAIQAALPPSSGFGRVRPISPDLRNAENRDVNFTISREFGDNFVLNVGYIGVFGFGLFGELSRGQAWLIVPVVWALMLLWSKWWLDRFRYGPFEWAWRCLARWERVPMRKAPQGTPAVA